MMTTPSADCAAPPRAADTCAPARHGAADTLRWRICRVCALTLVAALAAGRALALAAQIAGAELTGIVTDQAGAPVSGATVTVTSAVTRQTHVAATTPEGVYTVPGLPPGEYALEIALPGFKSAVREGLRLGTGDTMRLDVQLEVGSLSETVTVVGAASDLRRETATLGALVQHEQVV